MNWDALGAIGELVGATAVIGSMLYVAVQIRQNTEESRISRSQNLLTATSDANALIATDPDLARIVKEGTFDFDALSALDRIRFSTFFFSFMAKFDFAYHQNLTGNIDRTFWRQTDNDIATFIQLPGTRRWWAQDKIRFSPGFREYVDKRIEVFQLPEILPGYGVRSDELETAKGAKVETST